MFLTPNNLEVISLQGKKRIHLVGSAGIGMIGAQNWLEASGFVVSGSDLTGGIPEDEPPIGAELLVVSSAITDSHPQYRWARLNQIPVIHRSECIKQLMPKSITISVCGAHGKTTSSALLAHLLSIFARCSFMIGGFVTSLRSSSYLDKTTEYCVLETDESDGSMLNMTGRYALITNVDNEHLDYYGSFENYLNKMKTFAASAEKCFIHISCKEYGFEGQNLIWYGCDKTDLVASLTAGILSSDFTASGPWGTMRIKTTLVGEHMMQNILGCLTVLWEISKTKPQIKMTEEAINSGLSLFKGIKKRGELTQYKDVVLINDYAHHPTEIAATIEAYRSYPGKLKVIWEPHRYSRLRSNGLDSFKSSFSKCDELLVLPIHAASEEPDLEFTQESLAKFMGGKPINASEVFDYLRSAAPGEVIICMGAGRSYQIFNEAIAQLKNKYCIDNKT